MPRNLARREQLHFYADLAAGSPADSAAHALLGLIRVVELQIEHARAASGLSHNEFMALRYLLQAMREGRSASPGDLAIMLDVSPATVTHVLTRLEETGDARRVPHATDKRAKVLLPTAAGAAKIEATYGAFHDAVAEVLSATNWESLRHLEGVADALVARIVAEWPVDHAAEPARL